MQAVRRRLLIQTGKTVAIAATVTATASGDAVSLKALRLSAAVVAFVTAIYTENLQPASKATA